MYIGNNQIVEALNSGTCVRYDLITYPGTPTGYRRVD
jgi:hypothetical protein